MPYSRKQEQLLLRGAVGGAVLAIGAGFALTGYTGDAHWINRAGAAITATEGLVVIAEFHRRARLQGITRQMVKQITGSNLTLGLGKAEYILESEIKRAELHVLSLAVFLAVAGELLHGFGDLLAEAFHYLLNQC